jgi:hypothetical protein
MSNGPIEIFDSLVRGFILAGYDFVRLTVLGLVLPFLRGTRHVWPYAVKLSARLSSLTYLVLWIFIVVAAIAEKTQEVFLNYFGVKKDNGLEFPMLLITTFVVASLSDLLARGICSLINNRVRKELYGPLVRIAIANIFVGMYVIALVVDIDSSWKGSILFYDPFFVFLGLAFKNLRSWAHYPYFFFFGVALAIVIIKAFAIRSRRRALMVGVPIAIIAPPFFLISSVWLFVGVAKAMF